MLATRVHHSEGTDPYSNNISEVKVDSYLAKPSGICCLKGTIHDGEPRGSYETITGVETYISRPVETNANGHILLYFPDVWGLFKNGLLIMDGFADAGYLVLGLDYFKGVRVTPARTFLYLHELTISGSCLETSKE